MIHDWTIAEREYARHIDRRGRKHAFETLEAPRSALVVVDLVPFFSEANPYCAGIVPNVAALARAMRAAGGTVAWVLPSSERPFPAIAEALHGVGPAEVYRLSGGEGPLADRLSPGVGPEPDDLYVEKTAASAFFPGRCPLPDLLAARGVDTVVIAGTVTNVCCESSARDASTLGYRVVFAADANAARTDAEHNATLHTIYRSFGDVRPTSEILELLAPVAR